jgi:ethanolamine utilization microcompartment shell protein EutS
VAEVAPEVVPEIKHINEFVPGARLKDANHCRANPIYDIAKKFEVKDNAVGSRTSVAVSPVKSNASCIVY